MIRLDVDGKYFHVEFRHLRRPGPAGLKTPGWLRRAAATRAFPPFIGAITTCVIISVPEFTAIGTVWCWDTDNFSRRTGRLKSFSRAVNECGALNGSKMALLAAYMEHDPDPAPPAPRPKLTLAEKSARWEAGWEARKRRELERGKREARENLLRAIADQAAAAAAKEADYS